MDRFARTILGYHGFRPEHSVFGRELLLGERPLSDWRPSENRYDWLGDGVYFWEHGPDRAAEWAGPDGLVIGAVIGLDGCLDLTDTAGTRRLAEGFEELLTRYDLRESGLPQNAGRELKLRRRDCLIINYAARVSRDPVRSVRGAFEEGEPVFPGAAVRRQTHIQVAVRDLSRIVGIFRPNPLYTDPSAVTNEGKTQ